MRLTNIVRCVLRLEKAAAVILMCVALTAATVSADAGKAGWPIFKKAQTANTRGITSSLTFESSLGGLLYNPSILGARTGREAYLISEAGFVGDTLGGVLYGHPLKDSMIAGGIVGYDAGKIELNWIDNGNLMTQTASAQRDLLGIVSYGRRYGDRLLLGGTLKAATSEIAEKSSAYAFAADAGVSYMPAKNISLSAAIQNVGISTKFVEKENPLPTSAYLSGGYLWRIKNYSLLSAAGFTYNLVDETVTPEVGAELRYDSIYMNAGYRFNRKESVLQLGLGIRWNNVEFGYSYMPGVYLDATHRLNLSYKFGSGTANRGAVAAKTGNVQKTAAVKPPVSVTRTAPARKTAVR